MSTLGLAPSLLKRELTINSQHLLLFLFLGYPPSLNLLFFHSSPLPQPLLAQTDLPLTVPLVDVPQKHTRSLRIQYLSVPNTLALCALSAERIMNPSVTTVVTAAMADATIRMSAHAAGMTTASRGSRRLRTESC